MDKKELVAKAKAAAYELRSGTHMYDFEMRRIRDALNAGVSMDELDVTETELGEGKGSFYYICCVFQANDAIRAGRRGTVPYGHVMLFVESALAAGASMDDLDVTEVELGKGEGSFYRATCLRKADDAIRFMRSGSEFYQNHMDAVARAIAVGATREELGITKAELGTGEGSFYRASLVYQARESARKLRTFGSTGLNYELNMGHIRAALDFGISMEELGITEPELGEGEGSFYRACFLHEAETAVGYLLGMPDAGIMYRSSMERIRAALDVGFTVDDLGITDDQLGTGEGSFFLAGHLREAEEALQERRTGTDGIHFPERNIERIQAALAAGVTLTQLGTNEEELAELSRKPS